MDNKNVIASGISDNELARAFSELVADRWDNWDLSLFMAYLVDICAPAALPYLAEQFDVDGLQGFAIAENEQQQREIIKRSIALHKYIGTPWAIREACRTVGFPVIVIEEGVTAISGGPASPDDWARFRVLVEGGVSRHITADDARKLRLFVEFYKNERSHLVSLGFFQPLEDTRVFRPAVADRESMDVMVLEACPNPLVLDPAGTLDKVTVTASVPWVIEQTRYGWEDGTGDAFTLEFTGAAGTSEIVVASDPNTTAKREMTVEIKTTSGRTLGTLTIVQLLHWNAYSRAYSNAYNTFTDNTAKP
ncbi:phage tail protein [uncultured Rikenella sp.]|uniref:phage tail protein n=1 Tax=uncultured Rikenella sp. TaxID=368003 RepID=UPI0025CDF010|nr:phage tail protein [uncultured Rikenella sp.]